MKTPMICLAVLFIGIANVYAQKQQKHNRNRPEVSNVTDSTTIENEITKLSNIVSYPEYPGGVIEMEKFIERNLIYRDEASRSNNNRVVLRFVVMPDGTITNIGIIKGLNPLFDNDAVKVVKRMPKWIPARQGKKAVPYYHYLSVFF